MGKKSDGSLVSGLGWLAAGVAAWWAFKQLHTPTIPAFRVKSRQPESALITGASSGIGAVFARQLAASGYDLILVARRRPRLEALAEELSQAHGVSCSTLEADLCERDELEKVEQRVRRCENLALLVNNAGFGTGKSFLDADLEDLERMVTLHCLATLRLTRGAVGGMIDRGRGAIVNVSSVAGFMALPGSANYCATKGYVALLSRALAVELAGSGVVVQALCPGLTHSEFHDRPDYQSHRKNLPSWAWMSAQEVVEASLRGLERGQAVVVPGIINQALTSLLATPAHDLFTGSVWERRRRAALQSVAEPQAAAK